jgi:bifunctional non-homologous end joining protein LigD
MSKGPFDFCIPTRGTTVPHTPDWLHEIKYDGYRLRVERDGDRVRLFTRNGFDWTKRCPWIRRGRAEAFPLSLRKTNLARLLARRPDGIFVAPFEQGEIGPDLFWAACQMGLEGLVSKRAFG